MVLVLYSIGGCWLNIRRNYIIGVGDGRIWVGFTIGWACIGWIWVGFTIGKACICWMSGLHITGFVGTTYEENGDGWEKRDQRNWWLHMSRVSFFVIVAAVWYNMLLFIKIKQFSRIIWLICICWYLWYFSPICSSIHLHNLLYLHNTV